MWISLYKFCKKEISYEKKYRKIGIEIEVKNVRDTGCVIGYSYIQNETVSAEQLNGGETYYLQKNVNGEWKPMPVSSNELIVWPDVGRVIDPKKTVEFEEDWTTVYGNITVGRYRIIKRIDINYDVTNTKYHRCYVACQFTLNQ